MSVKGSQRNRTNGIHREGELKGDRIGLMQLEKVVQYAICKQENQFESKVLRTRRLLMLSPGVQSPENQEL